MIYLSISLCIYLSILNKYRLGVCAARSIYNLGDPVRKKNANLGMNMNKSFLCSPKVECSYETFGKQGNYYLRTHLAMGGTKWMETKHSCSQTQLKAVAAECWGAECGSREGAWPWHSHCLGCTRPLQRLSSLQNKCWPYFHFSPFFHKRQKSSFNFFRLAKTGTKIGLSQKQSGIKPTFEKWEIPVFI